MTESKSTEFHFWGRKSYQEADQLQESAWQNVKNGHSGIILGGEVDFVVTQGLRANPAHLLNSSIKPVQTRRGGETTLHSPGQLVIYPVISLRERGLGVKQYIEALLEASTQTFRDFGILAEWRWDPLGIWTSDGKIGFCGVQVRSGITQHGLALNLTNDLSHFGKIMSCGLQTAFYDKAENHVAFMDLETFFEKWCENFGRSQTGIGLDLATL